MDQNPGAQVRRENERPRPPMEDIRMIMGVSISSSSKKARKVYLRMVQNIQLTGYAPKMARVGNLVIWFIEEDARRLHHPHGDLLVVSIRVGDYPARRIRRNMGVPIRCGHPIGDSRRLPSTDHGERNLPGHWLLVRIQCHTGAPYFEFMEGYSINLPFDDQVPHWVRGRKSERRSGSSVWMLCCDARNGWPPVNHVHRRTTNGRTYGRTGGSNTRRFQAWADD